LDKFTFRNKYILYLQFVKIKNEANQHLNFMVFYSETLPATNP